MIHNLLMLTFTSKSWCDFFLLVQISVDLGGQRQRDQVSLLKAKINAPRGWVCVCVPAINYSDIFIFASSVDLASDLFIFLLVLDSVSEA